MRFQSKVGIVIGGAHGMGEAEARLGVRFAVIGHAGHFPHLQAPRTLAGLAHEFLGEHERAPFVLRASRPAGKPVTPETRSISVS